MIKLAYDVVCIGAGGAGITAAVSAAAEGAKVVLLSKEPIGYGNTRIAFGVKTHTELHQDDSTETFLEDLANGGEHINNPALLRLIATESTLSTMVAESLGHIFARDKDGHVSAAVAVKPGGHRMPRGLPTHGYGGPALGQSIRAGAARSGVEILEDVVVSRLLVRDGRVQGVTAYRLIDGEMVSIAANAVILATGGAGWLYYPHTDCLKTLTGDGYALALEAGAELVDMEQVQFIPFATTHPSSAIGLFIGESVTAGQHGRLLDRTGHAVLTGISTMTRAQVAVAIAREVAQGNGTEHGGLLLDLAPNFAGPGGRERWERASKGSQFQMIRRIYGHKAFRCEEPWDVCPSAHFNMGGVAIDEWGRSSVRGLLAAGEAAGGIHGGNRLGSAALSEIFIFGRRAGIAAASWAKQVPEPALDDSQLAEANRELRRQWSPGTGPRPVVLARQLQRSMWKNVGLVRSEADCTQGLRDIRHIREASQQLSVAAGDNLNMERLDAIELPAMLMVAEAIATSAQARRESRGAHFRADFPDRDEEYGCSNVYCRLSGGQIETILRPVGSWPQSVKWS